ncbi:MAG TPA: transglycosylase domain-containing protein, partial [Thermoanaerobaculia bacterium]|nr:transglycosylase domain-containing protein [Thermoanaerobaculia bacterium]
MPRPGTVRRRLLVVAGILTALVGIAAALLLGPFWRLTSQFDDITYRQPSRLYARPIRLAVGLPWSQDRLLADLREEGYRESAESSPLPMGRYHPVKGGVAVHLRSFPSPDGAAATAGGTAEVFFRGSRVGHLALDGQDVRSLTLAPPLLASYYGPEWKERRPVAVGDVPQDLVDAVLAAEDASFFQHSGLSLTGIVRAAWVDVRGHSRRQGGSTLTQQLVKNLYLTQERTLTRKVQEVVLTLILEMRFQKKQILEAYLNEIYLGSSGGVNLMGVGAAARAYFGKDASQLDLGESALLGGMISAPGLASPIDHPDRARERRDWVLGRMEKLGMADHERVARAMARPIAVAPEPLARRRAPFFADAAAQEAERRFGVTDLEDGGYTLFSTLDWRDQQAAQKAVEAGLQALDRGLQKGHPGASLQSALVSLDPASGELLAYVGGRGYGKSQFDRAGQAHRQMGSAFKPVVYAAAFESHIAMPSSFIEDAPLTVKAGNRTWSPKNDDGDYHGWVSVRTALEHSYNAASARLALQAGLPRIVELAQRMGLPEVAEPYPSVALGADAVTPAELATVYATFAAGGMRPPVHGLLAVRDRHGKLVAGTA